MIIDNSFLHYASRHIWSPGNVLNEHEDSGHILNYMCDLTQFIVSCILIVTRAETLSKCL